jgi:hypothetical protein
MEKCAAVLDRMEKVMPSLRMPMSLEEGFEFAALNHRAGKIDRFRQLAAKVEEEYKTLSESGQVTNPYIYGAMFQLYKLKKDYLKALDLLNTLARMYPNDPSIRQQIDTVQAEYQRSLSGSGADTGNAGGQGTKN